MRRFTLPAIGLLLVLAAPIRAQEQAAEQAEEQAAVQAEQKEDASDRPSFIPYDVPPKLENSKKIEQLMQGAYPFELRGRCNRPRCAGEDGPSGTVMLWLYVDQQGVVQKTLVQKSSGYEAMDEAGMGVANQMEFSPAEFQDEKTDCWLLQAITFNT